MTTIETKLNSIEEFLQRIESKMDNFMGFESISDEERQELSQIKEEMRKGEFYSYDKVFN